MSNRTVKRAHKPLNARGAAFEPCKHCGSTDVFVEREDLCAYQARCDGCGARGPIVEHGAYITDDGRGEAAAREAWNCRDGRLTGSEGTR